MTRESYARAGVDLTKVKRIQKALARSLELTFRFRKGGVGEPLRPIGHYGGVIDIGGGQALTLHTDGVGSKVLVAQAMNRFDTVGIDCVAMTVNDLICLGSEPIALLDYIALERENDRLVGELVKGLTEGARRASVAIVGGETAILGDIIKGVRGNGFDLVSMGIGVVEKSAVVDGAAIEEGDRVLGVESSGLHSNGYTLARRVFSRRSFRKQVDELGSSIGDALLVPTRIYVKPALRVMKKCEVHGIAHITGGAFSKLERLVGRRRLMFDLELPRPPPIFELIRRTGGVSDLEMYRTFNMGIGLCLCVPEAEVDRAAREFEKHGFEAHDVGAVRCGRGVRVDGLALA